MKRLQKTPPKTNVMPFFVFSHDFFFSELTKRNFFSAAAPLDIFTSLNVSCHHREDRLLGGTTMLSDLAKHLFESKFEQHKKQNKQQQKTMYE